MKYIIIQKQTVIHLKIIMKEDLSGILKRINVIDDKLPKKNIYIKTLNHQIYTYIFDPNMTLQNLINMLSIDANINKKYLMLILNNKSLKQKQLKLSKYGITNGTTLYAILDIKGD